MTVSRADVERVQPNGKPLVVEKYFIQVQRERVYRKGETVIYWADARLDCNMTGTESLEWAKGHLPYVKDHHYAPCRVIKRTFTIEAEVVLE